MADASVVDPAITAQINALTQQLAEMEKNLKATKEQGAAALKTAQEDAAKKLDAAQKRLVKEAVRAKAREAGILDDTLLDHLPIEGASYTDDAIEGVDAAIARLKEKHPKLFSAPAAETPAEPTEPTETPAEPTEVEVLRAKLAALEAKPAVGKVGAPPAKKGEPAKKPDVMKMDKKQWKDLVAKTRDQLARH